MKTFASLAAASAIAVLAASPAFAGWDRAAAWDPAYDSSLDRQIERAADRPAAVASGSAIATNDAPAALAPKHYFGANADRFVDSVDSPYDN